MATPTPGPTATTDPHAGWFKGGGICDLADYISAHGFHVDELDGCNGKYGGVTVTHGRYECSHYNGHAMDITFPGEGNDGPKKEKLAKWAKNYHSALSLCDGGSGHGQGVCKDGTWCNCCGVIWKEPEHHDHVHISMKGTAKPVPGLDLPLQNVPGGSGGSSGGTSTIENARAAIFGTNFQWANIEDAILSQTLKGERSLMNDKPIFSFIEQLCQGSMRQFQSMPNGNFYAFFADYFGAWGLRTPYWRINDIEILDGRIDLNDEALVTHQYVVGDTMNPTGAEGAGDLYNKLFTTGVVNLFNVGPEFIKGAGEAKPSPNRSSTARQDKAQAAQETPLMGQKDAIEFLKRYGARPAVEDAPYIRSPYFESFLAFQLFMLAWSRQFVTTFTFTFMPELFPGGIVEFEGHGIQCYVEEVNHVFDYENGFTTQANLSAPAATKDNSNKNISAGMVRSLTNSAVPQPHPRR